MDLGPLTGMCVFLCIKAHFLLWTWAFEQLGGALSPPLGHQSSVCGSVEGFSHVEVCFLQGGVFSHVQGKVFFAALDTCWPPLRISAGICTPESYFLMPSPTSSCLLSLPCPPRGGPGSGGFMYSDPWPPGNGGSWEVVRNHSVPSLPPVPLPCPPPQPWRSMYFPLGTSQVEHGLPGRPRLP